MTATVLVPTVLKASHMKNMETGKVQILLELLNGRDDQLAGVGMPLLFPCDPEHASILALENGQLQAEGVKCVGQLLYEGLKNHEHVQPALMLALHAEDPAPIYIRVDSELADRLPWETLYEAQRQFLALDANQRWPMARIVASARERQPERPFETPVRMMVVLAASQVSAKDEWAALAAALANATFGINVRVLVCESALKQTIEGQVAAQSDAERAARGDDWLTVDFLQSGSHLNDEVAAFHPHLIHFFCHGSAEDGTFLTLANKNDWDGDLEGSISLDPDQFRAMPNILSSLWLVTLNCCQGGAVPKGGQSFARALVSRGFPAVIAMREAVKEDVARYFTEAFYPKLFAELTACAQSPSASTELIWSRIMQGPRQHVCEKRRTPGSSFAKAAAEMKEWTLPVLYVSPERFTLSRTAPALSPVETDRRQNEIDDLVGMLALLEPMPGRPQALVDELQQRLAELKGGFYEPPPDSSEAGGSASPARADEAVEVT